MRLLSVLYQRDFLTYNDADACLDWLRQESNVAWATESFSIFGRRVIAPRRLAWSVSYTHLTLPTMFEV